MLHRRPDHTDAAELLGTLLFEAERFDELAALFEERIAARAPNKADLQVRLASLLARQLDRPARALDLVEEVLRERPGDERALRVAAEVMRRRGPTSAPAAALLEPLYEAAGRYAEQVEALETRAAAETSQSARAALLRRIAEVHEGPLRDAARAYDAASRALFDEPGDAALLDWCVRLAERASKLNELAGLLGAVAADADVASARALTRARARALEAVGRRKEAIDAWSSLLASGETDAEPLERLAVLLESESRWAELVEVLGRLAQTSEAPSVRAGLLERVAWVKEERLGDLEGALDATRRQVELEPDNIGALERMDRLCTALLLRRCSSAESSGRPVTPRRSCSVWRR